MCRFRAPRASKHAYLVRPLLNTKQHDIHDAHTRHRKCEYADDAEQSFDRQPEAIDNAVSLAGGVQDKCLGIRRIEFVNIAEHLSDLTCGGSFHRGAYRLKDQDAVIADVPHDPHDFDRDNGAGIVLGKVVRQRDLFVHHPDDGKLHAIDEDVLVESRSLAEELFFQVVSEHHHAPHGRHILGAEKPPIAQ